MIEIREYTKLELARLYRPNTPTDDSAVELFRRDVRKCKGLMDELRKLPNFDINAKRFPAAQVEIILEYMCEP